MAERPYDLVLFGASGFTGGITAEYLARHAPRDCRWALAGRNQAKLEQLREHVTTIDPECASLPLLQADSTDPESLQNLAASSRVVITTVGPYSQYGEPLVATCAANGTDYVDLAGEPEFVDRMYLAHNTTANRTGARLVHACGFDSVPYDLGVYFTVRQLPEDVPLEVQGQVHARAVISGGTLASALLAFSRARGMVTAARKRSRLEKRSGHRRISLPVWPHAATGTVAAGSSRFRRWTRRSWGGRPRHSGNTAPGSPIGTISPCGDYPRSWPPVWECQPCWFWPRSLRCAEH